MSRPALHALLNAMAAALLVLGWMAIRGRGPFRRGGRAESAHKRFMLGAVLVSSVFLASYVQYHLTAEPVRFWGTGAWRALYLLVLVPHVVLAALMVPPIVWLLVHALAGRFEKHRRLARWTLPVWLYVSVTGVLVYVMLYRLGPASG